MGNAETAPSVKIFNLITYFAMKANIHSLPM